MDRLVLSRAMRDCDCLQDQLNKREGIIAFQPRAVWRTLAFLSLHPPPPPPPPEFQWMLSSFLPLMPNPINPLAPSSPPHTSPARAEESRGDSGLTVPPGPTPSQSWSDSWVLSHLLIRSCPAPCGQPRPRPAHRPGYRRPRRLEDTAVLSQWIRLGSPHGYGTTGLPSASSLRES
ncbi:hypothetical protein DPEC_G00346760 [Dallia pectoralis]|uniref:Uncharacterized protein n=1 Tax=Dallia pectoralis TaxID=75939 RepID=A0ACC2F3W9_DALPE|nr:hypothetical protein DPEC_G00346760 [Dallia pectoralis]